MGEVLGRDQHGDIWVKKSSGGGGCTVLGVIGIALLIGAGLLCQSSCNYFTYRQFTPNTGDAQRAATATVTTPFHIDVDAMSADINGNASVTTQNNQQGVQIAIGGSVTFHVNAKEAGLYYLCAEGSSAQTTPGSNNPDSQPDIIIDVIVNGTLHDQTDTNSEYWNGIGGNSSTSCVTNNPVQLSSGANTIQIKLDKKTQCGTFACPALFVENISLDKKFD